mgnify:CR=1 FL=1
MKNYIYSTVVLFFIGINAFGQSPNWSVNENNFQYTMSFVSFVNVDGIELSNADDKVAAFVNGECRGITNLTYVASKDSYYAYLTVFSNENNEELINGAVYFWTHHASPINGKYSSSNYAAYVLGTGGIKAADDGLEPTNFLASCQGVFVNAKKAGNLEFNNGMRTKDPGNIFFKNDYLYFLV